MAQMLNPTSHVPGFPRKMTPVFVGLEIGFALAMVITQLLGLLFGFEEESKLWFAVIGWQVPVTLCSMVVPLWAVISERRAPHCFNYVALIVLYVISFLYFYVVAGFYLHIRMTVCIAVGVWSLLEGIVYLIHLIMISVHVGRHRKRGGHSKPTKEIEVVEIRDLEVVRVMSTDGSPEGTSSQPDIAHYPPDGINPLRMNPGDKVTPNSLPTTNNTRAIQMSDMLLLGSLKSSRGPLPTKFPEAALPVSQQPIESVCSGLECSSNGAVHDSIV